MKMLPFMFILLVAITASSSYVITLPEHQESVEWKTEISTIVPDTNTDVSYLQNEYKESNILSQAPEYNIEIPTSVEGELVSGVMDTSALLQSVDAKPSIISDLLENQDKNSIHFEVHLISPIEDDPSNFENVFNLDFNLEPIRFDNIFFDHPSIFLKDTDINMSKIDENKIDNTGTTETLKNSNEIEISAPQITSNPKADVEIFEPVDVRQIYKPDITTNSYPQIYGYKKHSPSSVFLGQDEYSNEDSFLGFNGFFKGFETIPEPELQIVPSMFDSETAPNFKNDEDITELQFLQKFDNLLKKIRMLQNCIDDPTCNSELPVFQYQDEPTNWMF